jgi:hypothetical protein
MFIQIADYPIYYVGVVLSVKRNKSNFGVFSQASLHQILVKPETGIYCFSFGDI